MDGIIIVNKPEGWTSFDVCAKIRGLLQTCLPAGKAKKVGHSGTLDPFATGVLPVFLGKATKSIEQFLNGDKGYLAEMVLGAKTDTGDLTGKIQTPNLQIPNKSQLQLSKSKIEEIFKEYTGEIEQVPPMYSAIKINGQRLYKLARKGIEVERKARKVVIYKLEIIKLGLGLGLDAGLKMDNGNGKLVQTTNTHLPIPNSFPNPNLITFYVECSKGTYIRQLASDIGDDLGCGAYLSALQRTYSHPFHISQAIPMSTIIDLANIGKLETVVLPVENFINN